MMVVNRMKKLNNFMKKQQVAQGTVSCGIVWEKMGFTDGSKCDILGMWRGNVIPRLQDVGGVLHNKN